MMLYRLPIIIETLSPVVLADLSGDSVMTGTLDFFPGSIFRGVLAKEYIEMKSIRSGAQEDAEFYELFLSGNLQFGAGYLWQNGYQALPLPFTLQADKDKTKLSDISDGNFQVGYKQLKGFGYVDAQRDLHQVKVRKSIGMHISRQSAEERIVGSSKEGQIYNYEALEADQKFLAYISGDEKYLEKIQNLFQNPFIVYVGRSKHTQYGKCQISLGNLEKVEPVDADSKNLWLHFTSDYIPEDGCFADVKDVLNEIIVRLQKENIDVTIGRIFSALSSQEGFVGVWGVKRELKRSLAAGTVLELVKDEPWNREEIVAIQQMGLSGVGQRCVDGFGRFQIYVAPLKFAKKNENKSLSKCPVKYDEVVRKTVETILWEKITERLQMLAADDIEMRLSAGKKKSGKHMFARLESIITSVKEGGNVRREISQSGEIRPYSRMEKNLQKLSYNGVNLLEILKGEKKAIYVEKWNQVVDKDMEALAKEVKVDLPNTESDKVYRFFWLWYCRMARKTTGKGDKE